MKRTGRPEPVWSSLVRTVLRGGRWQSGGVRERWGSESAPRRPNFAGGLRRRGQFSGVWPGSSAIRTAAAAQIAPAAALFSGPGRAVKPGHFVFVYQNAYPASQNFFAFRQDQKQQLSPQLHILPHQNSTRLHSLFAQ